MGLTYVDEEALLCGALPTLLTPAPRVGTATPADPQGTYVWAANGFVKVSRIGGTGRYGIDSPRVFAECFATTYDASKDLAARVRVAFERDLPGYRSPDGVVLACVTTSGPTWAPYDDTKVARFVATYTLTTHGH